MGNNQINANYALFNCGRGGRENWKDVQKTEGHSGWVSTLVNDRKSTHQECTNSFQ